MVGYLQDNPLLKDVGVISVVENEMVAVVSPGAKRAFWEGFVTFSLAGLAGFTS